MSPENSAVPLILLAEDEALLRMVAADTLRDCGYQVMEAVDGAAALEILKTDTHVDLLISDVKMPRMTGYQLVEAGLVLRPNLRVLLMTGYAQEPAPASIRSANIPVLYKPFDLDDLAKFAGDVFGS